MLWSIIEACLHDLEDDIIETDSGVELVRPRPVSETDKQALVVVLFEEMDEDMIIHFESIYGSFASVNMKEMQVHLERRKVLQMTEKLIILMDLFQRLDHRLMRKDLYQATTWLPPSRTMPLPPLQIVPVEPNVNVQYYHGFRGHRVPE